MCEVCLIIIQLGILQANHLSATIFTVIELICNQESF